MNIAYNPESSRFLSEKALEKYAKMIMSLEFVPYKKEILKTCAENISKNITVLESLKVIELILSNSSTQEKAEDKSSGASLRNYYISYE